MSDSELWLGRRRDGAEEPVHLPMAALLRHAMALGSSGSGKTVLSKVFVEEVARRGIPAICLDPQGDIASLLALGSPEALVEAGVDPALAEAFSASVDVVIYTPASASGVHLSADPVDPALATLEGDRRAVALGQVAASLVSLLGFDLGSDDGEGLRAVFEQALGDRLGRGEPLASLADVVATFEALDAERSHLERFVAGAKIDAARRKLARLEVGSRRALFFGGWPIDVDHLLGRDATSDGRTRVSVIYLNSLTQPEDKELVVGAVAERLYRWMLQHPSTSLQALFFLDEVAPYVPPVRKPACKESLQLLFKQARKYGVGCLMATQNPGDVDYKAMAQFGSWAIGRLTTRQDRRKVEPTVRSLAPDRADEVMEALPRLRAGEFVLLSPDTFDEPVPLRSRWLLTRHETFDEERVEKEADGRWRERFAPPGAPPSAVVADAPARPAPEPAASEPAASEPTALRPEAATPAPAPATPTPAPATPATPAPATPAPASSADEGRAHATPRPVEDDKLTAWAGPLAAVSSADAARYADLAGVSVSAGRRRLGKLVEAGYVGSFDGDRSKLYWARSRGTRPDLGLEEEVLCVDAAIDATSARRIAEEERRSRIWGLIGSDERFFEARLGHRAMYRLDFEEKVERGLLGRVLGPDHDTKLGSVYLHPLDLRFVTLSRSRGIELGERPAPYASEIDDFDGMTHVFRIAPGSLSIDEDVWRRRRPEDEVRQRFTNVYGATIVRIEPFFIPVWSLVLEQDGGRGYRIVTIDGVVGRPLDWPV